MFDSQDHLHSDHMPTVFVGGDRDCHAASVFGKSHDDHHGTSFKSFLGLKKKSPCLKACSVQKKSCKQHCKTQSSMDSVFAAALLYTDKRARGAVFL